MPIDVNVMEFYLQAKMLVAYMDFWLSYFYWWPSLACAILALIPLHINRHIFHDDKLSDVITYFVASVLWHALNLLFIHLVISKVGMLFAETKVLLGGNEQLLNNLDEGVIILDDIREEILYHNDAASGIKASDSLRKDQRQSDLR